MHGIEHAYFYRMNFMYNPWIRLLVPLFLTLYLGFLLFMVLQFREPPEFRWYGFAWFAITVYLMWEACIIIGRRLDKSVTWKNTYKRLLTQLLLCNLIGIAIFDGTFVLLNLYENKVLNSNNPLSMLHVMLNSALAFVIIQIINSIQISYQLLYNWQQSRLEFERVSKIKAIESLKYIREKNSSRDLEVQLTKLEGVIQEMPKKTSEMLVQFYDDYKASMNELDHQLEGVQDELGKTTSNRLVERTEEISTTFKSRFMVKTGSILKVVSIDEVAGFYKEDFVLLITNQGKKFMIDESLDELTEKIPPDRFFRINRQCIICIDTVLEARPDNTQIELTTSVDFPKTLYVSQRNAVKFKRWLNEDEL